jgi:hypothetical protein
MINSHAELTDALTIWALRGKKWRAFLQYTSQAKNSVISMEQRHIIKFLHFKGLKLQESATELSSAYGQDACVWLRTKYYLHQIKF